MTPADIIFRASTVGADVSFTAANPYGITIMPQTHILGTRSNLFDVLNPASIAYSGNTMYAVNYFDNNLYSQQIGGPLVLVGNFGFDVQRFNGFAIQGNTGWLASAATDDWPSANLYQVSLNTGHATLIGQIGYPDGMLIRGMEVIPEPNVVILGLVIISVLFCKKLLTWGANCSKLCVSKVTNKLN
jgi:hypothetical protein